MNEIYDAVVIGAGPAGMTAAIYLKRSNKKVLILEKSAPGGQVNRTGKVDNYPGFKSIDGPSLAMNMFEQLLALEVPYRYGAVTDIEDDGENKKIITDKEVIIAKTVVVAVGREPKKLGLPNETSLTGRGVSWCAICDGNLYKNKEVTVIGGGNSALEEGLYLGDLASKVTIVHRRNEFRGDSILIEKVKNHPKINIMYDHVASSFNEEDKKLSSVTVKSNKDGKETTIMCSGVFIYIGFLPATEMLEKHNILDDYGYVITDENMKTTVKGLFACGDVRKKGLFQIATAVGDGAIAAISAVKKIDG